MTDDVLSALLDGLEVARITRDRRNVLTLVYADEWRSSPSAYPISISMPLASRVHGTEAVEAFLWGLLPDNEFVLERWAQRFQVSPRNVFGLIANVGEDCAGAVQFVAPERQEELLRGKPPTVEWLSGPDIAHRLRALREDQSAWRAATDTGQFSLAGAQPKTALLFLNGRWGVPSGRMPTSHILKPPTGEFDGHAENEHLCLALARKLGLPAASSTVQRFDNEVAIVVERYDRLRTAELVAAASGEKAARLADIEKSQPVLRVHQEDMCQALGVRPTRKYQSEGGPTPAQIAQVLWEHSAHRADDVGTFVDALAFNWLIAGTDGHAKNYSILHGVGGRVRLAPLYDLGSALPYKGMPEQKLKLAMKIGSTYRLREILRINWERLAIELQLPASSVVARVADLASRLPESMASVREQAARDGLNHPIVDRLATEVTRRAKRCLRLLTQRSTKD